VQVLSDLRSRGIPIDGVGHEMHNAINYPSTAAMVNAINTVAKNFPDLDQQITELDMSIYNAGDRTSNYGNNVPASLLAEQGWLYSQYFDAFRQLSGKVSAVTIWGFADDDTWLDSFPVVRTDHPLPFDMGLQAKPAYWGIVDSTQLPGYGMTFSVSGTAGESDTRVLTVTATNGNVGPAYATQINGFTVTQVAGPPSNCRPTVTSSASYPIALGDIAVGSSASAAFTVSILGCDPNAQFSVNVPWSSAVYDTGTFVSTMNFDRGQ
jgi:endo-1,4-beta-xylanase